jgi:O-antigen ligase
MNHRGIAGRAPAVPAPQLSGLRHSRMPTAAPKPFGRRPRRAPLWHSRMAFFTDLGILILGSAGAFSVGLVGSLPINELLLFPLLPIALLSKGRRAFKREYMWFFILVSGWLLGTIIADFYFSSPMPNRLKGTARVVFFGLNFIALAILINNRTRRIVIFAMSLALVMVSTSMGFLPGISLMWKFGLSGAVAITALLISSYYYAQQKYWRCFFISLVLAWSNLYYGFRSQLVVHLVSAVLILPLFEQPRTGRSDLRRKQSPLRIIILLALVGGAAYTANAAIKYGSKIGLFDESLSEKFAGQSQGDYGVLVGGRPETLVAIQAIRDSPIIGHGSYPVDPKYLQLKQDIQYEHGYTDSDEPEDIENPVIPTHSHLTMAWVESGILGGICWIYILVLTFRAVLQLGHLRPPFAPLYSFLLVWFLWDILYSPFGSVNRLWAAFMILLAYHILQSSDVKDLSVRRVQSKHMNVKRQLIVSGRPRPLTTGRP